MINKETIEFLLEARKNTWITGKNKCNYSPYFQKGYLYERNSYLYLNGYNGNEAFSGVETVLKNDKPVFSIYYNGKIENNNDIEENKIIKFLKQSRLEAYNKKLFLGSISNFNNRLLYTYNCEKRLYCVEGREIIFLSKYMNPDEIIFRMSFNAVDVV